MIEAILNEVKDAVNERGQERDLPDGERTIPRCVKAFNAICGHNLTNEQGWIFMQLLKICRMSQGSFKRDDYIDNLGYGVLLAEEAFQNSSEDIVDYLSTCPGCGRYADNGHDREMPPNPYFCTKCDKKNFSQAQIKTLEEY